MFPNNFNGYGYPMVNNGYQQPMAQPYQQPYRQPQPQPIPQQPQAQPQQGIPLIETKFVTSEEAKAYIVMPNSASLLIDKANGVAFLKSANNMGQSFMESYEFKKLDGNAPKEEAKPQPQIDLSPYAKKEDLSGYATKQDVRSLYEKLEQLQRIGARQNGNQPSATTK